MDVYGAFQLCAIGLLAAPVTIRFSRTYFLDPARNIIFIWGSLLLIGLICLTIEFFRITPSNCTPDDSNNLVYFNARNFSYNTDCGLTCSEEKGPSSPLRRDSASNIYVIPSPYYLTFGTGVLLSAACCIPAILSLVSTWNNILEINWKNTSSNEAEDERIEGPNGATVAEMKGVNAAIRRFLGVIEVPIFGAAVLGVVIFGELNFWSTPVNYQTEPITSIGQWGPIVGTALAALGSLYVLLAADLDVLRDPHSHGVAQGLLVTHPPHFNASPPSSSDTRPRPIVPRDGDSADQLSMHSQSNLDLALQRQQSWVLPNAGYRRKVAKSLLKISSYFENAAPDRFDISEFKRGKALGFPEVPGEGFRNPRLWQVREQYNLNREAEVASDDLRRMHSHAGSYAGSVFSGFSGEGSSASRTGLSPRPRSRGATSPSPNREHRDSTGATNMDSDDPGPPGLRTRSDTLEVPKLAYHNHTRNDRSISSPAPVANLAEVHSAPDILASSIHGTGSSTNPPISDGSSTS